MAEAAGGDQFYGKDEEVVTRVNQGAGGQRPGEEAHRAENHADDDEEKERPEGVALLFGMQPSKENAGEH